MIRKLIVAAAFAVAMSPVGLAQDAPKYSTTSSTIGAILDHAEAKAAFAKIFPDLADRPELDQARDMTLQDVKGMAPEYLPDDKLKELDDELAKIK